MSRELQLRAERVMPGGVNSPVRAFKAVGGSPVFVERALGSKLYGADGREYIDYVGSWGPAILGHAQPAVIAAVQRAAERGLSFGAPTELEVRFAEAIQEHYPSLEMLRAVSSGTEASMSALRVARGFTGRTLIAKFDGAYHGHADGLLVKAGSGAMTLGSPDSAGVPDAIANTTLTLPFNDEPALRQLFATHGTQLAAVIVEPVVGNMGCVPPKAGFLEALVRLCREHGALSIFDEVMTGCRVARGGAQALYGLKPDMTCLGKIVGGGMPLAVYGGRRDVMGQVAPLGAVYQAGTLSGNPIAVSAGLATLELLTDDVYRVLEERGRELASGFERSARAAQQDVVVQRVGSMLTVFFRRGPVESLADALTCDKARFAAWHRALLAEGIYWPPSQFEAAFISCAHTEQDIERTLNGAERAFASLG